MAGSKFQHYLSIRKQRLYCQFAEIHTNPFNLRSNSPQQTKAMMMPQSSKLWFLIICFSLVNTLQNAYFNNSSNLSLLNYKFIMLTSSNAQCELVRIFTRRYCWSSFAHILLQLYIFLHDFYFSLLLEETGKQVNYRKNFSNPFTIWKVKEDCRSLWKFLMISVSRWKYNEWIEGLIDWMTHPSNSQFFGLALLFNLWQESILGIWNTWKSKGIGRCRSWLSLMLHTRFGVRFSRWAFYTSILDI